MSEKQRFWILLGLSILSLALLYVVNAAQGQHLLIQH